MATANDNFTGSGTLQAHTSDSGHSWTRVETSADVTLVSNQLQDASSGAPTYTISITPATNEYDITVDVIPQSGNWSSGPVGRVTGSSGALNAYNVFWDAGAAVWRLYRQVLGVFTSIGTYSGDSPSGTTRTVKMEIRDATKKIFIDGTERISSTDDTVTAVGSAGIAFVGYSSERVDNFLFADAGGGGGLVIPVAMASYRRRV